QALVAAHAGETEITGEFSVLCPLCAQRARHRVLQSAVNAARVFGGSDVGEADFGGRKVALPVFNGLPPSNTMTGHIDAMALYAGESVDGVQAIVSAAAVMDELMNGAERLLRAW